MIYLDLYLKLLWRMFSFDIWVYTTQLWMYYCLLIPAIGYTWFFAIKWTVLLFPITIPLNLFLNLFRGK